jgi:hypothetical protein
MVARSEVSTNRFVWNYKGSPPRNGILIALIRAPGRDDRRENEAVKFDQSAFTRRQLSLTHSEFSSFAADLPDYIRHAPKHSDSSTTSYVPTRFATTVRGPNYVVKKGKTPVWSREDAKTLLESIPIDSLSVLRDRALIIAMLYSFARVSAVIAPRLHIQGRPRYLNLRIGDLMVTCEFAVA